VEAEVEADSVVEAALPAAEAAEAASVAAVAAVAEEVGVEEASP
jgi:hypothetical protein